MARTLRLAEEILGRLNAIGPESVSRWGRMSAHQMVCHLGDAFRMAIGQKPAGCTTSLAQRTVVKWIALYLPLPWPGGIPTIPEIDQHRDGTRPSEFAADVAEFQALLALVTAEPRPFEWPPHPIFGRMSDAAWLRWAS